MLNDRPLFALCTSRIQNPEIYESVRAFVREAHSRGYGVLVFNSGFDTNTHPSTLTEASCASVFDLIPFQYTDLVVVMHETIGNRIVSDMIAAIAKEHRTPLLSYDGVMDGVPSVYSYSDQAFGDLLEHVFGTHRCKKVDLLTGIRGHYGSESMVSSYKAALRRHHLPFDEERLGYGNYQERRADGIAESFLSYDTPDAIVCASDEMAIAVCAVLRRHGLRVPEDVIVTGSDGIVMEQFHSPRLTTCRKDYAKLSAAACDTAEMILSGEDVPEMLRVEPLLHISESCGCCVTEHRDQNEVIRALWHKLQLCISQESEEHSLLGGMLERKSPNVIDYLDVMSGRIPENSYLCLRDSLCAELTDSSLRQFADASELMSTVMQKQYEKQFLMIPRANLIPNLKEVIAAGRTVLVNSIYMQGEVYGYYAYYGSNMDEECFKLPKFIHTAGNVIGCSLSTSRLQSMNEKLVAARIRDSLTGMLNMHGVMKMLGERVHSENHAGQHLIMIVIGLNRLRQINSIFGRSEGDQALLSLANAISDSIDSAALAARVGGDEFLISFFDSDTHMNTAEALISVLRRRMISYNQVSGKSYTLEISVGKVSAEVTDHMSLDSLLNEAITLKDEQRIHNRTSPEEKPEISEEDVAQMDRILNENLLSYFFQPIVSAKNGQIVAYEALMRTGAGMKVSPLALIAHAASTNRLYEIEWLTYNNVLKYVAASRDKFRDRHIFINSIPGHFLNDTDFSKLQAQYGELLSQLVVEFTEQAETEGEELRMIQARCQANGMDIAVDDYGTGYSNVTNLLKYSPNYVKIDRGLITNIHEEPKKQHFVTNIIEFAHANGFMALAEGVETAEELRAVIRFGADLIQGNFTSVPNAVPLETIPDRIAAMIVKFSASAAKQIMQKTYMLSGEEIIHLSKLDAEHYTDLLVSQPELEIIGDFNEASGIHIKIKDDTDCHIILRTTRFCAPQQIVSPAITLGKNTHVTLEFVGDNRMDTGGILVPETSSLRLTGKGNLSIRADDTKAFVIGHDPDFVCGDITIDLAGCLNILSNGNQCVGIGSGLGKGQKISVVGTKLFFEMSGKTGVGIGTLDGGAELALSGCEADFTLRMANSVAIGTDEGFAKVRCNTASLSFRGSGTTVCCIGSRTGGGELFLRDTAILAEVTGQNVLVAGSGDSVPRISLRHCKAEIRAEGMRAMDFGSYESDADLLVLDSDLDVTIQSAKAMHFAADPSHCVHTGGASKVAINQ